MPSSLFLVSFHQYLFLSFSSPHPYSLEDSDSSYLAFCFCILKFFSLQISLAAELLASCLSHTSSQHTLSSTPGA